MYRAPAHACPACKTELVADDARWSCKVCNGVFVPAAALGATIGATTDATTGWTIEKHVDPAGRVVPPRRCPMCRAQMEQVTLAGCIAPDGPPASIALDRCVEHGVWFDPHELAAVAALRIGPPRDTTPSDKLTTLDWLLALLP
jgi:hypothetical protein